jgi:hypothetical protein
MEDNNNLHTVPTHQPVQVPQAQVMIIHNNTMATTTRAQGKQQEKGTRMLQQPMVRKQDL